MWNYDAQIHFSWYGEENGERQWADAENSGSIFAACIDSEGRKQFCLNPSREVAKQ
jgi:hypothetical protein